MHWKDEGYLLSKRNFNENSIIIETFSFNRGKYTGIVYGGSSRKQKKNFQIGNKLLLNFISKGENRIGYINVELLKPISPPFFNNKEKTISILSASSILRILLPERQTNKKIYLSFEDFLNNLNHNNWIMSYIKWELLLIKELGFEVDILNSTNTNSSNKNMIEINGKNFKIPSLLLKKDSFNFGKADICEALRFNKNLIMENFIHPNKLIFPTSRNILEKYYN